jgi:aspartate-semialdehyde dehydrogenase
MVLYVVLQYAFNLFSHNAPILDNGYNEEEMKLVKETRKIWVSGYLSAILCSFHFDLLFKNFRYLTPISCPSQNDTEVKVTATCIRVPVMRAHAESVNLQFENPLDEVITHVEPDFY